MLVCSRPPLRDFAKRKLGSKTGNSIFVARLAASAVHTCRDVSPLARNISIRLHLTLARQQSETFPSAMFSRVSWLMQIDERHSRRVLAALKTEYNRR